MFINVHLHINTKSQGFTQSEVLTNKTFVVQKNQIK